MRAYYLGSLVRHNKQTPFLGYIRRRALQFIPLLGVKSNKELARARTCPHELRCFSSHTGYLYSVARMEAPLNEKG